MCDGEFSDAKRPLLRPRDQTSIAVLTAVGLVLVAAYWRYYESRGGGLIDIDRAPSLTAEFQVDVNRADWPELLQLPGLGPALSQRIVADRQAHGEFRGVDELVRVNGIGPRTLERIKPYLLPIAGENEWATAEGASEQNVGIP